MDNTPSRLGHIPRTYSTRSELSFISPLIEEKDYIPYRVSTTQVSERDENNHHVEKLFKNKENIVKESDESEDSTSESELDQITDHSETSDDNACCIPCKKDNSSSNEDCLAGESQEPDMEDFSEADIDQMVKEIEDAARKEIK
ncbi:hypothetical protein M9H77_30947 [Catharanthus roseus]|uniref:Uncharacterized protein n=1 Tax=Catharanthus roseus TaxID=4058 RepID=A0ACB9ZZR8_CATRO|nr:hypothetical protein M9H77_30947 [Catharanthus roseus]